MSHDRTATPYLPDLLRCTKCELSETRINVVPGRGDWNATLWLVGEAPGAEEDRTGLAFVGRAGQLLDMCLKKARIEQFTIVNILKCRPPKNRDPIETETRICATWMYEQLRVHNPRVIVAMGRYSIGFFRQYTWKQITTMKVTEEVAKNPFRTPAGRAVISTFHPAYLLRNRDALEGFISKLQVARLLHQRLLESPMLTA